MSKEELLDKLDALKGALVRWEYKWEKAEVEEKDGGGEGEEKTYGPFTVEEMAGWRADGYFEEKEGGPVLLTRQLVDGAPRGEFLPVSRVEFDRLY